MYFEGQEVSLYHLHRQQRTSKDVILDMHFRKFRAAIWKGKSSMMIECCLFMGQQAFSRIDQIQQFVV